MLYPPPALILQGSHHVSRGGRSCWPAARPSSSTLLAGQGAPLSALLVAAGSEESDLPSQSCGEDLSTRSSPVSRDIASPQCRPEHLRDIAAEAVSRHRPVQRHRRGHPVMPQRRHHGDTLPGIERHLAYQPLSACRPAAPSGHACGTRRLIDEHQPPGIELALASPPTLAHGGHVRAILFGRVQGFMGWPDPHHRRRFCARIRGEDQ